MKKQNKIDVSKEIREFGIILIVIGIIQLLLTPEFLFYELGALLIFLGFLSLIIRKRIMFIVLGIFIILLGLWNIFATGYKIWWLILGAFQIYLGIKELDKFYKTKEK